MSLRDRTIEFVEDHLRTVIAVTAGVLLLLVLILLIVVRGESVRRADQKKAAESMEAMQIRTEDFRYPSDPLPVPGIQRFRDRKQAWSIDEARTWYEEPTPESLEALKAAAAVQIDTILEAVP